jgi:hypothetical protein
MARYMLKKGTISLVLLFNVSLGTPHGFLEWGFGFYPLVSTSILAAIVSKVMNYS